MLKLTGHITNALPDRWPQLGVGAHVDPADGACLMEYISLLAGEPWSDRPRCTHPVLAELARLVNDESGDAARAQLATLAPALITRAQDDPRAGPAVVAAALRAAAAHGVDNRRLRRHRRRAQRRVDSLGRRPAPWSRPAGAVNRLYERGPAMHAVTAAIQAMRQLPLEARDRALRAVLVAGIEGCKTTSDRQGAGCTTSTAPVYCT